MIIFLYGLDTYRSRRRLAKMTERFRVERDPQGLNLVRLDAERGKENILQEIFSAPFLAEKRMVILENLLVSRRHDLQRELLRRIEEKTLPEDVILIIWEAIEKPKLKDAKALFDRLLKEKFVQYFGDLSGVKLSGWIIAEVKERGGDMERDAVDLLASNVGGDMWKVSGIIDQLVAYTYLSIDEHCSNLSNNSNESLNRGRVITLSDLRLFLEEKVDDNIFNLVDAIVNKKTKNAFAMVQEQYRKGEDAGYIFAMLVRQFRILIQLRDLYDRGENLHSGNMARELGIHPFVIKKSLPMVKRYTFEELEYIHANLLDIDIKTKTSHGDQSMLLDIFIAGITI